MVIICCCCCFTDGFPELDILVSVVFVGISWDLEQKQQSEWDSYVWNTAKQTGKDVSQVTDEDLERAIAAFEQL